jgi:hypothetical protein
MPPLNGTTRKRLPLRSAWVKLGNIGHEGKLNKDNTMNEWTNECHNNNSNNNNGNTGSCPGEIIIFFFFFFYYYYYGNLVVHTNKPFVSYLICYRSKFTR